MKLKVGSYFYTFAPSVSGCFTTEGEHQLSNSRTQQTLGVCYVSAALTQIYKCWPLCSANFYQEVEIEKLLCISNTVHFRLCPLFSGIFVTKMIGGWQGFGFPNQKDFPLCHLLQKAVGRPLAPTRQEETVASLGFSSQIGRLSTFLSSIKLQNAWFFTSTFGKLY
jgi:hypothetical protein